MAARWQPEPGPPLATVPGTLVPPAASSLSASAIAFVIARGEGASGFLSVAAFHTLRS
jgi:hypothetical protein